MGEEQYGEEYFRERTGNDDKRIAQFKLDGQFIRKHIRSGIVCDIGCSTGEFLRSIDWHGPMYGMEISSYARGIAEQNGVSFEKDITTESCFFDLVIFRGTIQHVDEPFRLMKLAHDALKPGGFVVFLATPNSNSPVYRLKGTLPFLDPKLNFYIPGARELTNALRNFGFSVVDVSYPYLDTPYRRLVHDHIGFVKNLFSSRFHRHAFWKSSMNLIAKK